MVEILRSKTPALRSVIFIALANEHAVGLVRKLIQQRL